MLNKKGRGEHLHMYGQYNMVCIYSCVLPSLDDAGLVYMATRNEPATLLVFV